MDFDNPGLLLSGMIVSALGLGVFIYGKKLMQPKCIVVGLGLMALPLFVHSIVWIWASTAFGIAGLRVLPSV